MHGTVLITGGAGFIGSHVAENLLRHGYRVRVLDSLLEQVHPGGTRPAALDAEVELVIGDVRDEAAVDAALDGIDDVIHLAARVGVAQSMYETAEYTSVNAHGTSVMLEALMRRPVQKLVVASSMSVYGEGLYADGSGRETASCGRTRAQLKRGEWEPVGPDGESLHPITTPERKTPSLSSIYALGKFDQERMALLFGSSYDVPAVALRLFNVYGRHQSLSNPYTGVMANFASRLLNSRPPPIFEDGGQMRDFVHVSDVAEACRLALTGDGADGQVVNVGSGRGMSIREVARRLAQVLGREHLEPDVTGTYRAGDIRHCFADISRAGETLGFVPRVSFDDGIADLAAWLESQVPADRTDAAAGELARRGLTL